eukprot:6172813-Pleurochrysis_carterae.AAC.2
MQAAGSCEPRTQAPEGAWKCRAERARKHACSALMYRRVKAPLRGLVTANAADWHGGAARPSRSAWRRARCSCAASVSRRERGRKS